MNATTIKLNRFDTSLPKEQKQLKVIICYSKHHKIKKSHTEISSVKFFSQKILAKYYNGTRYFRNFGSAPAFLNLFLEREQGLRPPLHICYFYFGE